MRILYLILCLALTSCQDKQSTQGFDVPPVTSMNLSGTWLFEWERRMLDAHTHEYLYSVFSSKTFILDDRGTEVQYEGCIRLPGLEFFATKTATELILKPEDPPFVLQPDGTFKRTGEPEEGEPGQIRVSVWGNTLTKISENVNRDSGTLVLNGNVSVFEYDQVCLGTSYSTATQETDFNIAVPYGNSYVILETRFKAKVTVGIYTLSGTSDVEFRVWTPSDEFAGIIEGNSIRPESGTLTIVESTDSFRQGEFEFTDQFGDYYTGEFEISF